ncbi:MAG: GtrA family protein [Chroococcales cyanobacterium]
MRPLIEHIRDISKMSVASWLATSLDFVVFTLFNRGIELQISIAAALGSLAGALIHFTICRLWVFRHSKQHGLAQSLGRYIIVSGGALILHSIATTLLAKSVIPQEELAWLISKNTVFLFWVYPGTKYIVFGQGHSLKRNPPNFTSTPKQR